VKQTAGCLLLALMMLVPSYAAARSTPQNRAGQKSAKRQQKAMQKATKKQMKAQRKSIKKGQKSAKKAFKDYRKHNPSTF